MKNALSRSWSLAFISEFKESNFESCSQSLQVAQCFCGMVSNWMNFE